MNTLWLDIRYAARALRTAPGFAAASILTLCLGIAGNAVVFSVVNSAVLRPMPYLDPGRLVWISCLLPGYGRGPFSAPDFLDYQSRAKSFDRLAAYSPASVNLSRGGQSKRLKVVKASAGLFDLLGARAVEGRTFAPGEDSPSASQVAVLSYALWRDHFGADPKILGANLTLDGASFTVVGVMHEQFIFPYGDGADIWVPLVFSRADLQHRGNNGFFMLGRLQPGVAFKQAAAELSTIAASLEREYPSDDRGKGIELQSLHDHVVGPSRLALLVLLGAVAFLLLIACANVANLLLARAAAREKEIAIRSALGAARSRIFRQLITESLVLWIFSAAAGLCAARAALPLVQRFVPAAIPRMQELDLDWQALGFTLALSLATGLLFGMAPALRASRRESLRGRGGRTLPQMLIVAEVALALVLAIGAGLMARSFIRLMTVEPGFLAQRLVTAKIWPSPAKYSPRFGWNAPLAETGGERRPVIALYRGIVERLGALPGVESAGVVSSLPLDSGITSGDFRIEGREGRSARANSGRRIVSADYFRTMRIPLRAGRWFTVEDSENSPRVVIVSESLVRRYFPGENPLGRRLKLMGSSREIVGVVGDIRRVVFEDPSPVTYLPMPQEPWPSMAVVVRTNLDPSSVSGAIGKEIRTLDAELPIFDVRTMEDVLSDSVAQPRFNMLLLGLFALLALALAAVGIYGVIGYSVARRTHEIGIRMAIGAGRGDVLRMILRQGLALTGAGVIAGLVAARALSSVLSSMLFGIQPTDPPTLAGMAAALIAIAALASYIPARRAAKVDPMVALRYE